MVGPIAVWLATVCLLAAAMVNAASNVVQLRYDAAGNIVAIERVDAAAITLTGIAPLAGSVGTLVTITGTGFGPTLAGNSVAFNGVAATVVAASTTTLTVAVPAGANTGRVAVTFAGNTATSGQDFVVTTTVVPPGGVAAADILATIRLGTDGPPQSIGLFATNKYGLMLFEGAAGAWLSLHVGNFTVNPAGAGISYTIYKPDNTTLTNGTLTANNLSIHVPALPVTGTYSLLLRTGIAQVSLDAKVESNAFLLTDGATLAVARNVGQTTRALIAATAGDQKALMVSGLVTAPAGNNLDITIALPNGSTFRKANAAGLGLTSPLPPFTVTGTHSVLFAPFVPVTQQTFKVGLVGGVAIPADGAAADVVIANPGQGARLTFAGIAGENLGLGVSGVALSPAAVTTTNLSVYKPDATLFVSFPCSVDGSRCAANLENLPVAGTYSIIVQPVNGATGTQRLWLSHDVTATLAGDAPSSVALSRPGQNARLTFAGTAGSLIALQVRGVTTNPPGQGIFVLLNRPDQTFSVYTHLTGAGQTLVAPPLPVTGTYTVFLEPENAAKGAATATMEVLLDPGRNLVIDGPAQDTAIGVTGGSARFLFAGTAGQNLGLGIGNLALTPRADATVYVYKPDGVQLTAITCAANSGGCGVNLGNLPTTGIYGIVVRPAADATGGFSVTLSSDLGGTLVVGGPALGVSLDRPGRNSRVTFAGTAGQTLRLSWSGVAIAGAPGNAVVSVSPSNGPVFAIALLGNGTSGSYDIPALSATGSYTIFVDPPAGATLNATLQIVAR